MCRIVVLTNASNLADMDAFSREMALVMRDQKDGYGYAALGEEGVYNFKTLYPFAYYKNHKKAQDFLKKHSKVFGTKSKDWKAAIFHGRISTNKIDLNNTHPMMKDGYSLIHNGVIENVGEKYKKETQNDSEDILYHYIQGGIEQVSKNVIGYYACAVFNPDGTLSVFRDSIAPLVCAWSDKLDSWIFASNDLIIDQISEYLDEALQAIPMEDNIYVKFNGNDIVEQKNFSPLERRSKYADSKSEKSIGKKLIKPVQSKKKQFEITDYVDENFLAELGYVDESYEAFTDGGKQISVDAYLALPIADKLRHVLKRYDGSVVDPFGYDDSMYGME
jgi:hypothetical protein